MRASHCCASASVAAAPAAASLAPCARCCSRCSRRKTGDSGSTQATSSSRAMAGTAVRSTSTRQPCHAQKPASRERACGGSSRSASVTIQRPEPQARMNVAMAQPRLCGGASSQMKSGLVTQQTPIPTPQMSRKHVNVAISRDTHCPAVPTRIASSPTTVVARRPWTSFMSPPSPEPAMAPTKRQAPTQPCCDGLRPRSRVRRGSSAFIRKQL